MLIEELNLTIYLMDHFRIILALMIVGSKGSRRWVLSLMYLFYFNSLLFNTHVISVLSKYFVKGDL
ncbi:hypothetical protein DMB45_06825 [Sanguibacteroides justesenii]|uniref:Uncharacterized protein n=1 Tax=Sanguibacteroides justesenii TaxID=1547597 RepID=A0A0C3R9W1_9PORP|nr:hypothetical protein BA92_00555 [Sanguibacteroides justesenii]PXZ44355.1 hypothetical protein DMB45_06825 [Sanguibacteroides justesenii]